MFASRSRYIKTKKAIAIGIAIAFLFNIISINLAWAINEPEAILSGSGMGGGFSPGRSEELDLDRVSLPLSLGYVKERHISQTGKPVVIYIQDAHCNYSCQKSIESIIDYFNKNYGVTLATVEGGAGDYDLSIFTSIPDHELREKIADYFVREGRITGVELFAILNPEKLTIKGLEEADLYNNNLNVYRESLTFKDTVNKYLKILKHFINNLKPPIFSKKVKEFDDEKAAYDDTRNKLKDYVAYLGNISHSNNIEINRFHNLSKLLKLTEEKKDIDFKKAEKERELLIDTLTRKLSKVEIASLVEKTVAFKGRGISPADFYEYIFRKAQSCNIDLGSYPHLVKYKGYLDEYDAVEKDVFFEEIFDVEHYIADNIFVTEDERRLFYLSDDLSILDKLFSISLTRRLYDYYSHRKDDLRTTKFVNFIHQKANQYDVSASINPEVEELDIYKERMGSFYKYSFDRDKVFIKNINKYSKGQKALFLVTGGFHTTNMTDLLKKNGYSYVLITPKIMDQKENPYYHLLAGSLSPIESILNEYTAALALRSVFSEMGIKEDAISMQIARDVLIQFDQKGSATILVPYGYVRLTYDGTLQYAKYIGEFDGKRLYAVRLDKEEITQEDKENMLLIDHQLLTYLGHEPMDTLWEMAHKGTNYLIAEDLVASYYWENIEKVLKEIGVPLERLFQMLPSFCWLVSKDGEPLPWRVGHASHMGIHITLTDDYEQMARTLLHELGAYYNMEHEFNILLEKATPQTISGLLERIEQEGHAIMAEGQIDFEDRKRDLLAIDEDLLKTVDPIRRFINYKAYVRSGVALKEFNALTPDKKTQVRDYFRSLSYKEIVDMYNGSFTLRHKAAEEILEILGIRTGSSVLSIGPGEKPYLEELLFLRGNTVVAYDNQRNNIEVLRGINERYAEFLEISRYDVAQRQVMQVMPSDFMSVPSEKTFEAIILMNIMDRLRANARSDEEIFEQILRNLKLEEGSKILLGYYERPLDRFKYEGEGKIIEKFDAYLMDYLKEKGFDFRKTEKQLIEGYDSYVTVYTLVAASKIDAKAYADTQQKTRSECTTAIRSGFKIPVILETNDRMLYSQNTTAENIKQQIKRQARAQVKSLANYDGEIDLIISDSRATTIQKVNTYLTQNRRPVIFSLDALGAISIELSSLLEENKIPCMTLNLKPPLKEKALSDKAVIDPFSIAQIAILTDALNNELMLGKSADQVRIATLKSDIMKLKASMEQSEIQPFPKDSKSLYNGSIGISLPRITDLDVSGNIETWYSALRKIESAL